MPSNCIVSGIIYKTEGDNEPARKVRVTVMRVLLAGALYSLLPVTKKTDDDGAITLNLPRNSVAYIHADVEGLDMEGGVGLTIPNEATADIGSLIAVTVIPDEGITVKSDGNAFANPFGILNLSSAFQVTESPTGQANIDLVGAGILSLNGLNDAAQLFAVDSTGNDFAVVSAGDTHTFNLPTASATKRGLLSTTDWSDFDSKLSEGEADGLYADIVHNHNGVYEPANANIQNHIANSANPHDVTKAQVGLGSVDNLQQLPLSYLDTDVSLTANSDVKVASQKAVKAYVAANAGGGGGSAESPTLETYTGNTTQYEKVFQAAGMIEHQALGKCKRYRHFIDSQRRG
jgi:hypothetical protein